MTRRFGEALGGVAARAVEFAEKAAGVVGWLVCSVLVGAIVTVAGATGKWPHGATMFQEAGLLAPWIALLAASVFLRNPARWIAELGLRLGFYAALGFGAATLFMWLFVQNADTVAMLGGTFLTSAEFGLGLFIYSAWRHRDQVHDAWLKFRRFLNGARDDGSDRNCVECAMEPLWPVALLAVALVGVCDPSALGQFIWAEVTRFGAQEASILAQEGMRTGIAPASLPPVLVTTTFWLAATGVFAIATYIALRRVGSGSAVRGFVLWLLSVGEIVGGFALVAEFGVQLQADSLGIRVGSVALALAAFAFAWFCHRRRAAIVGRRGDPMFGR